VGAAKSAKVRPCPTCGGDMRRAQRADTIEYKGLSRKVTQPGWYCGSCGEAVLEPADIKATEAAFFDLKAEADGLVTAEEVKRIRRGLGLSQREAGEVLGGGPRAFQKYESRTVMVSKPMSNLLRLLERHPKALKELSASVSSPGVRTRLSRREAAGN
jgi:HTH-type transcriptional regulator/antitoxin MqsA